MPAKARLRAQPPALSPPPWDPPASPLDPLGSPTGAGGRVSWEVRRVGEGAQYALGPKAPEAC